MTEALFAPAWWMLLLGVIAAVALFVYANVRLSGKLRLASVGLLLATALWWALGRFVETPSEAAQDGTSKFVAAAVARDTTTLGSLLSPSVSLGRFGKQDILDTTPGYADRWGLKGAYITGDEIEVRGTQVVYRVRVISSHSGGQTNVETLPTDWEFIWAKEPDGYRIIQITPLRIGTTDVRQVVESYFSNRR